MATAYPARSILRRAALAAASVKSTAVTSPPTDREPRQLEFAPAAEAQSAPRSWWPRALRILRPSHAHSPFSASVLLAASSVVSALVGLARGKYIAWVFGAGPETDAYMAAFRLPDLMNNFLVGGAVSITFVTILNRYRERGEEEEGEKALFTVLNLMVLLLTAASIVLMFLAGRFVRWTNPGFPEAQIALCAHMTRILLPAQIFLFVGSVLGATLLVRKQFLYQAATPILYNLSIIAGGVLLHRRFGVGSLGINAWGVVRAHVRFLWQIDLRHPGLRLWLFMTLPLMFGFTLPFLDQYFAGFYASHGAGDITRLANAKQLFSAPMSMLAQAAGVAAMPFFAQLWAREARYEFATGVADSVSRVISLSLLAASLMIALSQPLVELIFGGGRFTPGDVNLTAAFFAAYTLSLFAWSAQAIYARAFYAAGITWLPMLASTIILFIAFPMYGAGYRWWGAAGLALASDAGILLQAVTLAVLLHKRRMVSIASLDFEEMGRCLLGACAGGALAWAVAWALRTGFGHLRLVEQVPHTRMIVNAVILIAGAAAWAILAKWILERFGSALPRVALQRLRLG